MLQRVVEMPIEVVVGGRVWKLYDIHYDADDKHYSTYIYALDHYHAALMLEDLKSTGRVVGEVGGVMEA